MGHTRQQDQTRCDTGEGGAVLDDGVISMNENSMVQIRQALGLTQEEMGRVLGVSAQAVSSWERAASNPSKTSALPLYKGLVSLMSQSVRTPEILSPSELKAYIHRASQGELVKFYTEHFPVMDASFRETMADNSFISVLLAVIFDLFLEKSGKPLPRKEIMSEEPEGGRLDLDVDVLKHFSGLS